MEIEELKFHSARLQNDVQAAEVQLLRSQGALIYFSNLIAEAEKEQSHLPAEPTIQPPDAPLP